MRPVWEVGDGNYSMSYAGVIAARAALRSWYPTGDWHDWEDAIVARGGPRVSINRLSNRAVRLVRSRGVKPNIYAMRLERAIARELRRAGVEGAAHRGEPNWPELNCLYRFDA